MEYDFPKPGTIPIPQLEKPKEKREARPQSVLSNFEVPNYEELSMYSGKPSIMSWSVPTTPQQDKAKEVYGGAIPKRSGNLYVLEAEEYKKIEEKGLLFPSESMIMAGALEREVGEPQPSMQISKMQATPTAESTRIPLRTSTEKREKSLSSEQLLDLEKSEQYRQELKEAEESMLQACLEKSNSRKPRGGIN